MTSTWDVVQEYLTALAHLDDPDLFETGIRYVKRLIDAIHDADHTDEERLAKAIWETSTMKEIRNMVRRARAERPPPGVE